MHQNAWLGSNTSEMKRLDKDVSFQMHSFPSLFFFFFFFFLSFFLSSMGIDTLPKKDNSVKFVLPLFWKTFNSVQGRIYSLWAKGFFPLSFTVDPFSEGTCLAENKQEVAEIVSHVKMRKICQVYTVTVSQRLTILLTGLRPSKRLTGGKCHILASWLQQWLALMDLYSPCSKLISDINIKKS